MKKLMCNSGAIVVLLSSVTEEGQAMHLRVQEEDDTDDQLQNEHMEGHEMDAGDILAYSGEISGELQEPQPKKNKVPTKKVVKNQKKKSEHKTEKKAVKKDDKKSEKQEKESKPHDNALVASEQKSQQKLSKYEIAKQKLKEQEEELKKIEELEKQDEEQEKKEAILSINKPFTKPVVKNNTNSALAKKKKEAEQAALRLKQTNEKIALLQKQKSALNSSKVQVNKTQTFDIPVIPPNLGTPVHSSQPQNESDKNKKLLASKKSETQEKIEKLKARTAEMKAKTAKQKAKLEEMKKKKVVPVEQTPQVLVQQNKTVASNISIKTNSTTSANASKINITNVTKVVQQNVTSNLSVKANKSSLVDVNKTSALNKTAVKPDVKKVDVSKPQAKKPEQPQISLMEKPSVIKPAAKKKPILLKKKKIEKVQPEQEESGPEPTEQQIAAFKKAMDYEKNSGTVLDELEKDEDKEKEENDQAAKDAMKDLDVCYGDDQSQKEEQKAEDALDEPDAVGKVIKKQDSIVTLMRGNNLQSLATTGSGLDSLIGATGALEMAEGDTEYLKRYSEKVAAEADQSDELQQAEELKATKDREAIEKKKQEESNDVQFMSVKHAKELAAQQLKQLNDGVAAAEAHTQMKNKMGGMFSAFSTKVNIGKAQQLASKLGVATTPQMLELGSNQEIYNQLIQNAMENGKSQTQIDTALDSLNL